MAGEGDVTERLKELNIVPLAISYEYDPCDFLKAKELQQKRDDEHFQKSPEDDLINMQTGLYGYKGRIHFQTSACLNHELDELKEHNLPKCDLFTAISETIDRHIHSSYRLFAGNYVACDLLMGDNRFTAEYTEEEKSTLKISGTADCQSRSSQQRHRLPASCFADYVCQSAHQLPESGKG